MAQEQKSLPFDERREPMSKKKIQEKKVLKVPHITPLNSGNREPFL